MFPFTHVQIFFDQKYYIDTLKNPPMPNMKHNFMKIVH